MNLPLPVFSLTVTYFDEISHHWNGTMVDRGGLGVGEEKGCWGGLKNDKEEET